MKKVHSLKEDFLEKFSFILKFVSLFKDLGVIDPKVILFWEEEERRMSQEINNRDDSFNKKSVKAA